jgi:hypothetical protein
MLSWGFGIDPKKYGPADWKRPRQLTPIPISELRREIGTQWSGMPQEEEKEEKEEGIFKKPLDVSCLNTDKEEFYPLTKMAYQAIVKAKRREQVHSLFLEELMQVFDQLEEKATQMTDCHFEVSFDINEAYNIDKVEILLRDYFMDLGFEVIVAERGEDDERKVVFTLT